MINIVGREYGTGGADMTGVAFRARATPRTGLEEILELFRYVIIVVALRFGSHR